MCGADSTPMSSPIFKRLVSQEPTWRTIDVSGGLLQRTQFEGAILSSRALVEADFTEAHLDVCRPEKCLGAQVYFATRTAPLLVASRS
jgi:uncharacterized protein YjbI with pentapeptide repeats